MHVELFRSGKIVRPHALEVFQTFDDIAFSIGADALDSFVARSDAVFFCLNEGDAVGWANWRLYEYLDANVYSYDVTLARGYAYEVKLYNSFAQEFSKMGDNGVTAAMESSVWRYYASAVALDSPVDEDCGPFEVLLSYDDCANFKGSLVRDVEERAFS